MLAVEDEVGEVVRLEVTPTHWETLNQMDMTEVDLFIDLEEPGRSTRCRVLAVEECPFIKLEVTAVDLKN